MRETWYLCSYNDHLRCHLRKLFAYLPHFLFFFTKLTTQTTSGCARLRTKCSTTPSTTPNSCFDSCWTRLSLSSPSKRWAKSAAKMLLKALKRQKQPSRTQASLAIYYCLARQHMASRSAPSERTRSPCFHRTSCLANSSSLTEHLCPPSSSRHCPTPCRCSSRCCRRNRSNGRATRRRDRRGWPSSPRSSLVSSLSPGWKRMVSESLGDCHTPKGVNFVLILTHRLLRVSGG